MLKQFDEAVFSCRTPDAKDQISEAIKCYESGAYRSAIVMAYVAVCYDLIDKLRALEVTGDGKAKLLLGDLLKFQQQRDAGNDQALGNLLKFERELIEKFRDEFEFFGVNEYDEIARLREDRNRCAHPTFLKSERPYSPSAELARLHIRNAITFVLSQEPKQGKAAIEQFERAILSPYFPEKKAEIVERFKLLGLAIAREPLVRGLVDHLVFNMATAGHPFHMLAKAFWSLDAVIDMRRPIAAARTLEDVSKLLNSNVDDGIRVASIICIRNADVRNGLEQPLRAIVNAWIQKGPFEAPLDMVQNALAVDWMNAAAQARLTKLKAEDFSLPQAPVAVEILDTAAKLYCTASNWDRANELAVNVAAPYVPYYKEEQLRLIFEKATDGSADLQGSHGFSAFVKKLYEERSAEKQLFDDLTEEFGLEHYRP